MPALDLTRLPLTGVITKTEKCDTVLPPNTESVRCVYMDEAGNRGEITVPLN